MKAFFISCQRRMLRPLIALLLLTSTLPVLGYSVKFRAVEPESGEGEPFATVRVYALADTLHAVTTGVTDNDGRYDGALPAAGHYTLRVTAVGRTEQRREFTLNAASPTAELGDIALPGAENLLEGVTVTAIKPLVTTEIDRLNYDVQNDADSRTLSALDMLRKVPLVSVDGENQIRVKGGSSFLIYRNGHPDPSLSANAKEVLQAIPASMIKRIEVITDPGAKYDAEGVSTILNIVMVEQAAVKGATGTVTAGIDTYGCPEASAYVTAQSGKFVTSVNYGYHLRTRADGNQRQHTEQQYTNGLLQTSDLDADTRVKVHYGSIEASYEADTLNLITASFDGYYYSYDADATTQTQATLGTVPQYAFTTNSHMPGNNYYSFDGRADYQHRTSTPNEALTLSYMITASRSHTSTENTYSDLSGATTPLFDYTGFNQDGHETFWEHTFQFDWTRPFAVHNKVETGLKYIYRLNESQTTLQYTGGSTPDEDSRFRHLTQVGAAYVSYTYTLGSLTARAGLRYEWSRLRASFPDDSQPGFYRDLNDWVPSASINYRFSPANTLTLSYATSIARPGISYLNPAVVETPTTVSFGNAHLSSARQQNFSLTYMHIGRRFTLNVVPYAGWSNNSITNVQWTEDGKVVNTYANTLRSRNVGINAYCQWQATSSTSVMVNGNVARQWLRSDALGLRNARWVSNFFTNLTQQLPWRLRLSGYGGCWGGYPTGLYGYSGHSWFYGLSLQRSFLRDDRLTVRLRANRPFSAKYSHWDNHTTQGDYTGMSRSEFASRLVSLSVSYRFGNLNASVKKTAKTITNDDVVGGSNQQGGGGDQQGGGQQGGM